MKLQRRYFLAVSASFALHFLAFAWKERSETMRNSKLNSVELEILNITTKSQNRIAIKSNKNDLLKKPPEKRSEIPGSALLDSKTAADSNPAQEAKTGGDFVASEEHAMGIDVRYPERAKRLRLEGRVAGDVFFDLNGRAREWNLVEGHNSEYLNEVARAFALHQKLFQGRGWTRIDIKFSFRGAAGEKKTAVVSYLGPKESPN